MLNKSSDAPADCLGLLGLDLKAFLGAVCLFVLVGNVIIHQKL